MRKAHLIVLLSIIVLLAGCCATFNGYGRYTLRVDCDKVKIDEETYEITRQGADLVVGGHTLKRGIYRKTRPWLYIHHMYDNKVDLTFDEGSKAGYPLYTGASASIFDVYAKPWEMTSSTNAEFSDNFWLISHRWSDQGIFFDLQRRIGDETQWQLVREDIFVPGDGSER